MIRNFRTLILLNRKVFIKGSYLNLIIRKEKSQGFRRTCGRIITVSFLFFKKKREKKQNYNEIIVNFLLTIILTLSTLKNYLFKKQKTKNPKNFLLKFLKSNKKLLTMDVLALVSMKNAAKCDNCELQNSVNHTFERNWHSYVIEYICLRIPFQNKILP
eukprot:01655_4